MDPNPNPNGLLAPLKQKYNTTQLTYGTVKVRIIPGSFQFQNVFSLELLLLSYSNKKAVLMQGNRAMPQLFFSVKVIQGHVFWSQCMERRPGTKQY